MMRLNYFVKPARRPLLILAVIVLGVVGLAAGGWWFTAYRATADYRAQTTTYLDGTKKSLVAAQAQLKEIAGQDDVVKSIDALAHLQDTLAKQAAGLPGLPQLFGVTLTPKEDTDRRALVIQRANQLAQDVKSAHDLLVYEHTVAVILRDVTTKTGADAAQQKTLAEAWQAMATKLKAVAPPTEAGSVHKQLVDATVAAQASLAGLPDLFAKTDVAGFAVKQKEAQGHVDIIRDTGKTLANLALAKDKTIARDYADLADALK